MILRTLPFIHRYECFALKGGTAINMFLKDLPRLSVDIDLVYLPINNREDAIKEITIKLQSLSEDINNNHLAKVLIKQQELKLILITSEVQIKIEVSMMRGHLLPVNILNVCNSVETAIGFAQMKLLNTNEIYAGKICAALDRQHPRDLFDIKIFLENAEIDNALMNVFMVYLMCGNRPIAEFLSPNFKNISETYQKHFVGMTLQPVSLLELEQAREKLLKKIHFRLHDGHKRFLLSFKKGEANWQDFYYPEAQCLPAIQWKQMNLNKMPTKKRLESINKLESILAKIN